MECLACRYENPSQFRFCGQCGQKLPLEEATFNIKPTFENKLTKLQQQLVGELPGNRVNQRQTIAGERKLVTVMFCDLVGYTSMVERLDPEVAYNLIDQVYELLIRKVHHYEGTVNEMTGDGVMAFFGAPIALENAPQRAVESALAIHRAIAKLNDEVKTLTSGLPELQMRIGIHTGTVVVGSLGIDLRMEFKAVGNTVNLASRVENLAKPGTTYLTEATYKLTDGFFLFESVGEKEIKGIREPVAVYHAIAPGRHQSRFDVNTARGLTTFVGRDRELELMLDCFRRTQAGHGQVFSIVSQAGVGKSRLLFEFRKAIANEDATFLEGHCYSYSRNVAYHSIIDMLKMNFAIEGTDSDVQIREKLQAGLARLGVDEPSTLPYLLELMSVQDSGIEQINISREARKQLIIEAIKQIVLPSSELRPLILAFEDAHWVDPSTWDVAMNFLEVFTQMRILFIFTYRPDFMNIWETKPYHSRIVLNRLSNRESLQMVAHLLNTENAHPELEALVLEKTEGVPFFIEEFIRSLLDLKLITRQDGVYSLVSDECTPVIPTTIQEVIMARVDVLPEKTRTLLRTASVIEREFSHRLLKEVTGLSEKELLAHVSILKDVQLLFESGIYPDSTYVFKHALTREVLYSSLLHVQKTKLHQQVGNALESLYRDNIEDHYGFLVQHFTLGKNYSKSAFYAKLAGRKAQKAASFVEAIAYTQTRIECLEKLPRTADTKKKLLDTGIALAGYYLSLSRFADAKAAIDAIEGWAEGTIDPRAMARIQIVLGLYSHWIKEDNDRAGDYLIEALNITSRSNDFVSMWFANFFLGIVYSWACEFEKGLDCFEKTQAMMKHSPNTIGAQFSKGNLSAFNYFFNGKINLAYTTSKKLLESVGKSGDIYVQAMAYGSFGAACFGRAYFNRAEQYLRIALTYAEKAALISWQVWSAGFLGHTYVEMGTYEKAVASYDQTIKMMERSRLLPSWTSQIRIARERARVLMGDPRIPVETLKEYYADIKIKAAKGWAARHLGEIVMYLDDPQERPANEWFERAITENENKNLAFFLACDYEAYARWFALKKDFTKAIRYMTRAKELFSSCGANGWQEQAEGSLEKYESCKME